MYGYDIMSIKEEEYLEFTDDMDTGTEMEETGSAETTSEAWDRDDTFRLIAMFKEHENRYRAEDNKSGFWKFMQQELLKYDINKTTKSIRTKWSNLLRTYKMIVKNQPNRKEPKKFAFFWALDDILKHESSVARQKRAAEATSLIDLDNILVDVDEEGSEGDYQNDTDSNGSSSAFIVDRSKSQWRNHYYNSRITELEDRQRFRNKRLKLAVAREERKIRHLALKEKKFHLAEQRYELDKRRLILDEKRMSLTSRKGI